MRINASFFMLMFLSASVFAGTWSDDFQDGILADWEEAGQAPVEWDEANGVVISELPEAESGNMNILISGDEGWGNYTVNVKAKISNLVGGDWCGMLFRYGSENSFYWFGISAAWTSHGWGTANETKDQEAIRVKTGEWHELQAELNGESLKLSINGQLIFDVIDNSLTEGRVGLFAQNVLAEFDDFSVNGTQIPNGGPGYSVESRDKLPTEWGRIRQQIDIKK